MLLVPIALLPFGLGDPAPGLTRSKASSRDLECEILTAETGSQRHPGEVIASRPRGDYVDRTIVVCTQRLMRPGLRSNRDEAILSALDVRAGEIATASRSLRPDLQEHTWLVETYYPSAQVATKIGFATKNALMELGLSVSDRVPTLSAGDLGVLTRMAPDEAYPAACMRYFLTGGLGDGDVLLALVSRDPRETILHAGICTSGRWTWLR